MYLINAQGQHVNSIKFSKSSTIRTLFMRCLEYLADWQIQRFNLLAAILNAGSQSMLLTRIPFGVRLQNEATNGNKMEANTGLFLQRKEEKLENQARV